MTVRKLPSSRMFQWNLLSETDRAFIVEGFKRLGLEQDKKNCLFIEAFTQATIVINNWSKALANIPDKIRDELRGIRVVK